MKANELRIGNLFKEQYSGQLIKVIALSGVVITFDGNFKGKWQAEPIPLTQEWLLKFGLKHDLYDDRFTFEMGSTDYVVEKQDDWYFIGVKYNTSKGNSIVYFSWHIYHVHQLQNLYFALTLEELTTS